MKFNITINSIDNGSIFLSGKTDKINKNIPFKEQYFNFKTKKYRKLKTDNQTEQFLIYFKNYTFKAII